MLKLPVEFGDVLPEEEEKAEIFQRELRDLRRTLGPLVERDCEFFDVSFKMEHEKRKTIDRKIKYFNQMSYQHAILLVHEFRIKLVCSIDSYIVAIQSGNPLIIFLTSRYILEYAATVEWMFAELSTILATNFRDIEGRGGRFLSTLLRARNSSSDPALSALLKGYGLSKSAGEPILIKYAIEALAKVDGFETVASDYDYLSNICHHNGAAHRLFHRGFRKTNVVYPPGQPAVVTRVPEFAVTLRYPAVRATNVAKVAAAGMVFHCARHASARLRNMPLIPFSPDEAKIISNGKLADPLNYTPVKNREDRERVIRSFTATIGRNDRCSCGSGKKYKICCLPLVS